MTMSTPPSSFQTVQNESIGASANAAIPMSPVAPILLQGVPNQTITVSASPVNPPNLLQQGIMSPHANHFQTLTNPVGSPADLLQQGTMSPDANQFQTLTNAIGSPPNPLQQGTMSPQGNQFPSLRNPIGNAPNPLHQGTMSPEGNQFNPIGSPAMTIEELKMGQSANMTPSVQMVPSEVQMGEMTPTPTGQQVLIHILKKLDLNQLQQLQSGSPLPISENQLQEIQGEPVDDSKMDLFASGDEDQI